MKRRHAFCKHAPLVGWLLPANPCQGRQSGLYVALSHDVDMLARSIVRDLRLIVRKSRWDSSKACRSTIEGAVATEKQSNLPRRGVPPRTLPRVVECNHKVNTGRIGWTTYFPIFFGDTFRSVPSPWKTLADATPPLPCFYPHSEWAG